MRRDDGFVGSGKVSKKADVKGLIEQRIVKADRGEVVSAADQLKAELGRRQAEHAAAAESAAVDAKIAAVKAEQDSPPRQSVADLVREALISRGRSE